MKVEKTATQKFPCIKHIKVMNETRYVIVYGIIFTYDQQRFN